MTLETFELRDIIVNQEFQTRANGLDKKHVEDLMVAYELPNANVPPIQVWFIEGRGNKPYLAKGFHRYESLAGLDRKSVECEVMRGTYAEAMMSAAKSNTHHGLKRTHEDKRRAVQMALACHPEWSDRRIAEEISVSHTMVGEWRAAGGSSSTGPRVGKNGQTQKVGHDGPKKGRNSKPETDLKPAKPDNKPKPVIIPEPVDDEQDTDDQSRHQEEHNAPAPPVGKLQTYYRNDGVREMEGVYRPRLTKSESGQETVLDAYGNPMPAGLGDTFADPAIREILANIASVADDAEQIREKFNELKAARKAHQIYTWAEIPTVSKFFDVIRDTAVKLTDHLRDAIPYAVCPDCSGAKKGCKACRGSGYWPKSECEVYPERFRKGAAA